jgi:hypothetical protein
MYAANHPMECRLREDNGKRSILITNIKSVEEAIAVFEEIKR